MVQLHTQIVSIEGKCMHTNIDIWCKCTHKYRIWCNRTYKYVYVNVNIVASANTHTRGADIPWNRKGGGLNIGPITNKQKGQF